MSSETNHPDDATRHRIVSTNLIQARITKMREENPDAFSAALRSFVVANEAWIREHGGDDHPLLELLDEPRLF